MPTRRTRNGNLRERECFQSTRVMRDIIPPYLEFPEGLARYEAHLRIGLEAATVAFACCELSLRLCQSLFEAHGRRRGQEDFSPVSSPLGLSFDLCFNLRTGDGRHLSLVFLLKPLNRRA